MLKNIRTIAFLLTTTMTVTAVTACDPPEQSGSGPQERLDADELAQIEADLRSDPQEVAALIEDPAAYFARHDVQLTDEQLAELHDLIAEHSEEQDIESLKAGFREVPGWLKRLVQKILEWLSGEVDEL